MKEHEYVSDELWEIIAPLLPPEPAKLLGGRPRISDRAALNGILFVLHTGIGWEHLPQELGFGSGMTCWRRLRDWQQAGVWSRLHRELLQRLQDNGQIDWSHAAVDASTIPAKRGRGNRTESHRSRASWDQTACGGRPPGDSMSGPDLGSPGPR